LRDQGICLFSSAVRPVEVLLPATKQITGKKKNPGRIRAHHWFSWRREKKSNTFRLDVTSPGAHSPSGDPSPLGHASSSDVKAPEASEAPTAERSPKCKSRSIRHNCVFFYFAPSSNPGYFPCGSAASLPQ
jgi:hypothetical protein